MKNKPFISEVSLHLSLLTVFVFASFVAADCAVIAIADPSLPRIAANTNRTAAGIWSEGVLKVQLEIREGAFYPKEESGASLQMFVFAEAGKQLQIPGPMIRVPQDTRIQVTIHSLIARDVLLYGMHSRPGKSEDTITIPAGATREATFSAGAAGVLLLGNRRRSDTRREAFWAR